MDAEFKDIGTNKPAFVLGWRHLLAFSVAGAALLTARDFFFPVPQDPYHNELVDKQEQNSLDKCYFGKDPDNALAKRYQPVLGRLSNASLELLARENITFCIDPVLEHDNYRGARKAIVAVYYPQERIIAFDPMFTNRDFDKALLETPSWANFKVYNSIGKPKGERVETEIVPLGNEATEELLTRMPVFRTAPAKGTRREGP